MQITVSGSATVAFFTTYEVAGNLIVQYIPVVAKGCTIVTTEPNSDMEITLHPTRKSVVTFTQVR